ncbi:MAG: hypothetical protein R3E54_10470 [Halioglobus sp.]
MKIDVFNFTRYGLIIAKGVDISDDAVQKKDGSWTFKMRLALEKDSLQAEGKYLVLHPSVAVAPEIITGKRRPTNFFLSPLLRYWHGSLRERRTARLQKYVMALFPGRAFGFVDGEVLQINVSEATSLLATKHEAVGRWTIFQLERFK